MSYLSERHARPAEWDALARVSDRCLRARGSSFCQAEIISLCEAEIIPEILPAGVKWRLWCELGELGTVEICKSRPGMSEIIFSGLGPRASDELAAHYQTVKKSFLFLLSQEAIMQTDPGALDADQQPAAIEYHGQAVPDPQEIPELTDELLIKLRNDEAIAPRQISKKYFVPQGTINNRYLKLKKKGFDILSLTEARNEKLIRKLRAQGVFTPNRTETQE